MFVIPGLDQGPYARDKHQTWLKGLRIEQCSRQLKDIVLFSSLVQARDDGLGKGVDKSYKTRYLHSINNADCNAGKATTSQCHVIPGQDQGPYARDKH